jgi:hypothetical protein
VTTAVIDAGPAINFLATNNERILLGALGGYVSAPETVAREVARKARNDNRFTAALSVWAKLENANRITILNDDVTPELQRAVSRITGLPMAERLKHGRDLGELMVIAHASRLAEAGDSVVILIDDANGQALAQSEQRRLDRLGTTQPTVGSITLMTTPQILSQVAHTSLIPDRTTMRSIYRQLKKCDDGLVAIGQTHLLSDQLWI